MRIKHKEAQLWLTLHSKDIRHWLVIVVGIILVVFAMISYNRSNEQRTQLRSLAEQNKTLSEQNKKLNLQSQSIARQNRSYTRCVAEIFAQYTHDFVPITILNLDTCTIDSQTKATGNTPSGGTPPQSQATPAPANQAATPPSGSSAAATGQGGTTQDGITTPRILFIPPVHIGSPF